MISAVDLTKRFGDFVALDSLNTQVGQGSIYGLVGANGSGKSTFLRLISGIYFPDAGSILLDDQAVYENPTAKDQIFYLSDDLYFPPKTTTQEMASFYQGLYSGFDVKKFRQLGAMFPIDLDAKVSTFSKGMRRQAALLAALSSGARYLLLDEAFDGLDPVIRLMVKKLLAEEMRQRELTVVITSHNLRELEELCDHIGLLHGGKILFEQELGSIKFDFCKVQAVFDYDVDWAGTELQILQKQQRGRVVNLLVRGNAENTLRTLEAHQPIFSEVVPLTLEEIFIGEMEEAGYDYNNILS